MTYTLAGIAFTIAALDWLAVWKRWKRLRYFAKPGVMLALLTWLLSAGGLQGQLLWFALGLVFSLAGDVFLMLPEDRFLYGLVAFLFADLSYIAGFNTSLPPFNLASLALAVLIAITGAQIYRRLAPALDRRGLERLKGPVLTYVVIHGTMLFSALLTLVRPDDEWLPSAALLASAGALLFFSSDVLLAWNRFVGELSLGDLKVMVTYHLGQVAITAGALLNFLR
ncbi:MAG TPA: lysoplasmalogenase [Dehalococcoidia bacterium]|nr:lysoplasmalogenase [Dehalococcoidia bacterium]